MQGEFSPEAKREQSQPWGVRELAERAGVTANTVTRIENGSDAKQSTLVALQSALEAAGVQFIPENGGGAGVRLTKPR